jgi:hypothetical protein
VPGQNGVGYQLGGAVADDDARKTNDLDDAIQRSRATRRPLIEVPATTQKLSRVKSSAT